MFSTLNGAKACARDLHIVLDDSGLLYPLTKCQGVIARAGGFRDWHDLEAGFKGSAPRPVDSSAYRRRLLAALPFPARGPVQAWLDGEHDPEENLTDPLNARHWYRDTHPYESELTRLYMGHPLLRIGSGPGQRLRMNLVIGPLLNLYGGARAHGRLEPDTLALVIRGSLQSIFRKDFAHPNFQREFQHVQDAQMLHWSDRGVLRILPPPDADVVAGVLAYRQGTVEHWGQDANYRQEQIRSVRDVMAHLGARDAIRIAEAIVSQGSVRYVTASGATLDLMSEFASERRLDAMSHAYSAFAAVHPANAEALRKSIPAKITQRYLSQALGLKSGAIERWAREHPNWEESMIAALPSPRAWADRVEQIASDIAKL